MTMVNLQSLFLNRVDDPSVAYEFPLAALTVVPNKNVESRRYAGGRDRKISRAGKSWDISADLGFCSRTLADIIDLWTGDFLCLRDVFGRKFFGFYNSPDLAEVGEPSNMVKVSIKFETITHSEAV